MKFITAIFCVLLLSSTAIANVKPNSLFTNGMVLQRGATVPVWGTADDGEIVTVTFHGQSLSATTTNGKWMVRLSPMPYITSPEQMTITGKDTVIIKDILVGEVWLCSGQSNMERQLGPRPPQPLITNWETERDAANYPSIREYYVPLQYAPDKIDDVKSKWTTCSPQTVSDFSAVGYFFAKNLYENLHVPIGILFSAFGGTPAEDWTSKAALEKSPELAELVKNYKTIMGANWHPDGQVISGLYNGMIYPLIPYAIKGVAWYQGESNNDRATQYQTVLSNMINNWREDFAQGDFPFLIVQIAPHKDMKPELREAQLLTTEKIKNTALIVTTDCGDSDNIHPSFKQPVGERLALAAEHLAYHESIEYSGPVYQSYKIKGAKIILHFSHAGKGLVAKNRTVLKGFTIAGNDNNFVTANAIIKKYSVIVNSDMIRHPVAVRYGWANVPNVNLYNSEGLPASPFRTDIK